MVISYIVDNDRKFQSGLERAFAELDDLRAPFALILTDFYKSEKAIFSLKSPGLYPDLSTKPFYAWWETGKLKRLYPGGYKEYKEMKVGFAYPILKRSGKLEASLLGPSSEGSIANIGPKELTFGTSIPYAIYHQSDAPRKKIPLRKMLFIGPESTRWAGTEIAGRTTRWLNILNDAVLRNIRKNGVAQ